MKSFKNFIAVLATINVLGAVACIIIMFISMSSGDAFWPTFIPISASLLLNAIVFAFIDDLAGRVDRIEDLLKRKEITFDEEKQEQEPRETQTVFRPGEPVKLKNKITIDGIDFEQDALGMVKIKKENNIYVVEFDEKREKTYEVSGSDLKSFFDK